MADTEMQGAGRRAAAKYDQATASLAAASTRPLAGEGERASAPVDETGQMTGPELVLYRHYQYLGCGTVVDPVDVEDCAGMAVESVRVLRQAGYLASTRPPAGEPDAPKGMSFGRRNPHCSNCGDERGGDFGHESNECRYRRGMRADELAATMPPEKQARYWEQAVEQYFNREFSPAGWLANAMRAAWTNGVDAAIHTAARLRGDDDEPSGGSRLLEELHERLVATAANETVDPDLVALYQRGPQPPAPMATHYPGDGHPGCSGSTGATAPDAPLIDRLAVVLYHTDEPECQPFVEALRNVLRLHEASADNGECRWCSREESYAWPCPTVRALAEPLVGRFEGIDLRPTDEGGPA